ncbi:MAG: hypothetical protein CMO26_01510 [Thiotrichales bacterium]|nr:hypothetical protein [Thiotrichales bacterium]
MTAVPRYRQQAGFSLLEVVVAFGLFVTLGTVVLDGFAGGSKSVVRAEHYSVATAHAQSLLDTLSVMRPIEVGERTGELGDGFSFAQRITPYQWPDEQTPALDLAAFVLEVSVYWDGSAQTQTVTLRTLSIDSIDHADR